MAPFRLTSSHLALSGLGEVKARTAIIIQTGHHIAFVLLSLSPSYIYSNSPITEFPKTIYIEYATLFPTGQVVQLSAIL